MKSNSDEGCSTGIRTASTLTFDGQQFLQRARTIEASVSDATRGPHRWGTQVDGTVDVAVSYTVAGYFLPALLARFWRAFPGITVRLHEYERDAIEHSLMSGSVDAAVMLVSNLHDRRSIRSRLLLRSPRRLWACANHPLLHKDSVRLADLAGEPFLMLTVDEGRTLGHALLAAHAARSQCHLSHPVGGGRSQHGGDRHGHHRSVRHGLPARGLSKDTASISRRSMTRFTPWTSALRGRAKARLSPAARAFCEFVALAYPGPDPVHFD